MTHIYVQFLEADTFYFGFWSLQVILLFQVYVEKSMLINLDKKGMGFNAPKSAIIECQLYYLLYMKSILFLKLQIIFMLFLSSIWK